LFLSDDRVERNQIKQTADADADRFVSWFVYNEYNYHFARPNQTLTDSLYSTTNSMYSTKFQASLRLVVTEKKNGKRLNADCLLIYLSWTDLVNKQNVTASTKAKAASCRDGTDDLLLAS
jgi:hypothetical protein